VTVATGTWVTTEHDLNRLAGYRDLDEFLDAVAEQTDMEVEIDIESDGVTIQHFGGEGQPQSKSLRYPFDSQDMLDWVYHVENDNSIRFDICDDIEEMLAGGVVLHCDAETKGRQVDDPIEGRLTQVVSFVRSLLFELLVDLDGSDLLPMSRAGCPLELTATHVWVTPTIGKIIRPYRPALFQPTVARLYPDGRLALAWRPDHEVPENGGIDRVLQDLLILDFTALDRSTALDLYQQAQLDWEPTKSAWLHS
jgi:hypothetical protein